MIAYYLSATTIAQRNFLSMMKELNRTARKYLGDSLLDTINWSPDIANKTGNETRITFNCHGNESAQYIYLLLGLILMILCGFGFADRCCKRGIRVEQDPKS